MYVDLYWKIEQETLQTDLQPNLKLFSFEARDWSINDILERETFTHGDDSSHLDLS